MKSGFDATPAAPQASRMRAVALMMAAVAAGVPAVVAAQATPPSTTNAPAPALPPIPAAAPAAVFPIKGFTITGENPLGEGETTRVLAPYLRADATIDTLQKATAALEAALRDKGFGLHRVALPPQEVGDTVTLSIVKFTINRVTIEGRSLYDEANVRMTVPELREGHTPNFKKLAVQTAIANENPNKQIQVGLKESDEPDKIDAAITVKESKPWNVSVGISNSGTPSSGRDRTTVSGSHSNLFDLDHQFTGAYTTSIEKFSDVKQIGLQYRVPLYQLGGVVGASYTRSDVVGDFGAFTSTGAGHTFGVNYTFYLEPDGGRRSFVTLAYDDKVFDAGLINGIQFGQVARRSRPVTLGYTARVESDTAFYAYTAEFAANTNSGSGNDAASYANEDPRITTTRWRALRGSFNYSAGFAGNWLWGVRGQAQYSPQVLISGEQFGLGGLGSVRGTSIERPLSGDRGVSGTIEITTPEVAQGLRFIGFVDGGWLANNSPNGASKPSSDRLASVGLGLRYGNGPFAVSADYGRIVSGSSVPLAVNASAPQRGDDKLYLSVSLRF